MKFLLRIVFGIVSSSLLSSTLHAAYSETLTATTEDGITWRYYRKGYLGYCLGVESQSFPAIADYPITLVASGNATVTIPLELDGHSINWIGAQSFSSPNYENWSWIKELIIPEGVQYIESFETFSGADKCERITLPDSLKLISGNSQSVFPKSIKIANLPQAVLDKGVRNTGMSNVESITLTDGVICIPSNAFKRCYSLTNVTCSSNVRRVCYRSFAECGKLSDISIPNTVTNMETEVFVGCTNLLKMTIPFVGACRGIETSANRKKNGFWHLFGRKGVGSYSSRYWTQNFVVDGITYQNYSFEMTVKSVLLTDETDMGDGAFSDCTSITNITLSSNLQNIGTNSFYNCSGLSAIVVPNSVTNVGAEAFNGCTSLRDVSIGNGVATIGRNAFANCDKISTIKVPQCACTQRMETVFPASYRTSLSKATILNGTSKIGDSAFSGCLSLSSVTIPGSVTNIGNEAFYNCSALEEVIIPDSVESIGARAFANCSAMKMISLPVTLSGKIPDSTFAGCSGDLEVIYRVVDDGTYLYWDDSENEPNPPMPSNYNVSITPTTRNFGVGGGGGAIITSGSGTWTAAVSEPWITLNATSGTVGSNPVAYMVSATTNVEQRVGYVYVSGHTHIVTQNGHGATIDPVIEMFEHGGGVRSISVSAQNKMTWKAKSNDDWIGVRSDTTSGSGSGNVYYYVMPYDEVATREGTLTVAGNTFSVFQYGRRMKLSSYSVTNNYEVHVIPITVNALATTTWDVTPNGSWISVVDAGNGRGSDMVSIAISENPGYRARTGTVTIGTETFTVTQQGRPTAALSFNVSPTASTASVEGANGLIAVMATPDLPWTATSGANWLTVYAATATGAGNGNVVYVASPNPTLSQRTGTITVTPETASGMAAKTHTVTQPAATAALSSNGYEFEAVGESYSVEVSVASIVQWNISESLDWLTVNGSTSRTGPGTVTLQASANDTVYPRSGTVTIAGKTFNVSQKARGVEVEYENKVFATDGGDGAFYVHPDGNVSWSAVASDSSWIIIFGDTSGSGYGTVQYILAPYVGTGTARTGWITVGDKKVYITQRAYDLNINPNGTWVAGNNGVGEFSVAANINDVWTAIVTEPWITIVSGYDSGTGSGTVRFLYTENTTGKTRTGKIIVNGEVYTLQQRARTMVSITATAEHGGHVSGGGSYDLGTSVTLTAVPDSGYSFSYWTGAVESVQNPLVFTADVAKSVTAVFAPMPIAFTSAVSDTSGVLLAWNNLAWAATYRIYRGVTSVPSSATVLAELPNTGDCTYLDESGDVDVEYWYWIEAEGASDDVMSDPMTGRKLKPVVFSAITYENLRGATNPNPATYQEGTLVTFANPGTLAGYTFAGWTPAQLTTDVTGAQTVRAAWQANSYSISYNPNGGSGTMDPTTATYDSVTNVAANGFTYAGHVFAGWATNETGNVVYAAGQTVSNLTAQSSGVVTLYAKWEDLVVAVPTVAPSDGTVFTEESCTVTLSCATEGADIYYNIGSAPRATSKYLYSGPFTITGTAEIYTFARKEGINSDPVTKVTITKRSLTLAEAAGAADLAFTTGGDASWTPVGDATAGSGLSARSGTIGDDSETWIQASVAGAGTISFAWKVDCEEDYIAHEAGWDHLAVSTNGANGAWIEVSRIDGASGWQPMSITFADAGTHTIRWTFVKDGDQEEVFADLAWLSGVTWTPSGVAEPFPEVATNAAPETVAAALAGAADAGLAANVTDGTNYNAFCEWAARVKGASGSAAVGTQTVKESVQAWLSYALGADRLITKEPTSEDVKIESFAPSSTDGKLEFTVSVKDVNIGGGSVAEAVLKENLKKVLGIEGAASLTPAAFSPDNIDITFDTPVDGKAKFTVAPPADAGNSFFMRVKVK